MVRALPLTLMLLAAALPRGAAQETLVVHEWGTFTSFQDEHGAAIGRLNVDDEPVPAFVHDSFPGLLTALDDRAPEFHVFSKSFPAGDPQVTMRLETPVLYFHPAPGAGPLTADVRVDFHGGWLTQFFPDALSSRPAHREGGRLVFAPLTADTLSLLHWGALEVVAGPVMAPATTSPVWTAPRQVAAANVRAGNGEGERFLFYRGVGHLDAPVRTSRDEQGGLTLQVAPGSGAIQRYFLVDIRPDGALAYRTVAGGQARVQAGSERFADGEYAAQRAGALRSDLAAELVGNGMFPDEAQALLTTWEASYFRSPGLRLFFLVPRAWVDAVLPLSITPQAHIERAMVGRIELISPRQREALARIAAAPPSTAGWWEKFLATRVYDGVGADGRQRFRAGGEQLLAEVTGRPGAFARLALAVPVDYAAYLALGRFRESLVLSRLAGARASELSALRHFAGVYGVRNPSLGDLEGLRVPTDVLHGILELEATAPEHAPAP